MGDPEGAARYIFYCFSFFIPKITLKIPESTLGLLITTIFIM